MNNANGFRHSGGSHLYCRQPSHSKLLPKFPESSFLSDKKYTIFYPVFNSRGYFLYESLRKCSETSTIRLNRFVGSLRSLVETLRLCVETLRLHVESLRLHVETLRAPKKASGKTGSLTKTQLTP